MRSSSGEHYIALDHVRALAAFLVFAWHFIHSTKGYPIPFEYVPSVFCFSLLDEGHTGVALFMALSGYLFAKLLNGRVINYMAFFWNRSLRLLPLLTVVILIVGVQDYFSGNDLYQYSKSIAAGIIRPSLPNGGWSITIEFHFYLMLPVLLWLSRKSKILIPILLITALMFRMLLHYERGEIQSIAYWTIVGRLDQFLLGMLAFQNRKYITKRHVLALGGILAIFLIYHYFNLRGGFCKNPSYPSPSRIWIVLPTLEGIAYALAIAYYDSTFCPSNKGISGFIGRIGAYSYSIYLLHFFVVFRLASFIHKHIMDISNFYLACSWSFICFVFMMPIGYLSFRFIETPFLRLRRRYIIEAA